MPHTHWKIGRKLYTLAEAFEAARADGDLAGWDAVALAAMERRRESVWSLSPSMAAGCPRERILRAMVDYALDPNDEWRLTAGSGFHDQMEEAGQRVARDGDLIEAFLTVPLHVPVSTGAVVELPMRLKIDRYFADTKRLTDYKSIESFTRRDWRLGRDIDKELPKPENVLQVNAYAYALRWHGYPVEEADLYYTQLIGRPQRKRFRVALWPDEEVALTLIDVATPLAEALVSGKLPPPLIEPDDWPPSPKKPSGPCRFCPVARQCRELRRAGQEDISPAVLAMVPGRPAPSDTDEPD